MEEACYMTPDGLVRVQILGGCPESTREAMRFADMLKETMVEDEDDREG